MRILDDLSNAKRNRIAWRAARETWVACLHTEKSERTELQQNPAQKAKFRVQRPNCLARLRVACKVKMRIRAKQYKMYLTWGDTRMVHLQDGAHVFDNRRCSAHERRRGLWRRYDCHVALT